MDAEKEPKMSEIKELLELSDREYRVDVRGTGGKIKTIRLLERDRGGQWQSSGDVFTEEHCKHFGAFAKAVLSVAKDARPPLNLKAIMRKAEGPARKKERFKQKSKSGAK